MQTFEDPSLESLTEETARHPRRPGGVHRMITRLTFPVLFAIGIAMAWSDLEPMLFWKPADAVVMQSDVERVRVSRSVTGRANRFRTSLMWRPRIQYRWMAGGRGYTGDQYALRSPLFRRRAGALDIAHRFSGGQAVTAWVDPRDPSQAVLDRAPGFVPFLFLAVVSVLAALTAWVEGSRRRTTPARSRRSSGSGERQAA